MKTLQELKDIIAKNIVELRKFHNLTQLELAEKLNYSDKSISKWERGESIPDVIVLKELADLFGVSLDYMVESEHTVKSEPKVNLKMKFHNHSFITGMSIILVWLLATLSFVITDIITKETANETSYHWFAFIYAIPVSLIVWLVLNSVWFNKRRNFLIISLLMWSGLFALFISFIPFMSMNIWEIFVVGIPSQVIILLWSKLRSKNKQ